MLDILVCNTTLIFYKEDAFQNGSCFDKLAVSCSRFGVGVLVGHFALPSSPKESSEPKEDLSIQAKLKNAMKSSNIEEHLRYKHDDASVSTFVLELNLTKF